MKKFTRLEIIYGLSILLGIQIILLVILNIFSFQNIKFRSIEKPLINNLKKENIICLEITDYIDTFSIEKKDGIWMVKTQNKYIPSNLSKIDSYLDILTKLTQGIVVYNNQDESSDKNYGFDKKNVQTLIIKTTDKKEYKIDIGNTGSRRGTSYIRFGSEKKIREVVSNISTETSNEPFAWAKKSIFDNVTDKDIKQYEIFSNLSWFKGSYKILLDEANEKANREANKDPYIIEPKLTEELENFALQTIIRNLINLRIAEYKVKGGIEGKPILAEIKLTLRSGKPMNLSIYQADKDDIGNYIIKTDFNEYLYLIHEDDLKTVIKDTKDLIKKHETTSTTIKK